MALKYYDCKTNLKVDLKRLTLKAEGCCRGAAEGCSGTATCRVFLSLTNQLSSLRNSIAGSLKRCGSVLPNHCLITS